MSKRDEIKEYVDTFVAGLTKRMREAANEAVDLAFGDAEGEAAPAKKGRKQLRVPRAVRALPAAPPRGGLSSADVLAAVKSNPGLRSEQLAATIDKTSKDIKRPLLELVAIGKVRKSGNGRGTTYTAGR